MKVVVDLRRCQDQGQCVLSAPAVFSLDDTGRLALRRTDSGPQVSVQFDEALIDDVEDAVSICPTQALTLTA